MPRRRSCTTEQIITKLRETEILLGQGKTIKEACKHLEISKQTYYRWCRKYGDMDVTQAKKLKEVEKENTRLKKLVADLSLDNAILKEVLGKVLHKLLTLFTAMPFTVTGTRAFEFCQVSSGRVPVSEVDPQNLRLLKVPNLLLAGELSLDRDKNLYFVHHF
jgi:putative transposase